MNKAKAKGYRTVARGRQILLDKGYIGANLEKTGKFVKEKDLFSLWDYIFIKKKEHLFIQFKSNLKVKLNNGKNPKWTKPHVTFGKKHGSKYVKYEIWSHFDREGFRILKCK